MASGQRFWSVVEEVNQSKTLAAFLTGKKLRNSFLKIAGRTDERTNGRTNEGRTDERTNERINEQTNERANGRTGIS